MYLCLQQIIKMERRKEKYMLFFFSHIFSFVNSATFWWTDLGEETSSPLNDSELNIHVFHNLENRTDWHSSNTTTSQCYPRQPLINSSLELRLCKCWNLQRMKSVNKNFKFKLLVSQKIDRDNNCITVSWGILLKILRH